MEPLIKKYPVQHPLLKKYIKFFWAIRTNPMQIDHRIIPVRNIDLKFNLSETPHYEIIEGQEHRLEEVYFSGLQDHFRDARLQFNGSVDLMGVCFFPEGFYPFMKIPLSEFRNRILGAGEAGFRPAKTISEQLKETRDTGDRLIILERELVRLLDTDRLVPVNFRQLFTSLTQSGDVSQVSGVCERYNIGSRKLERLYNKYVGIPAKTYYLLNRFQNSLNQLLSGDYSRLTDIAYENGYFDQMHFIKEFRRFAGHTPKIFVPRKDTMLHIGKPS